MTTTVTYTQLDEEQLAAEARKQRMKKEARKKLAETMGIKWDEVSYYRSMWSMGVWRLRVSASPRLRVSASPRLGRIQ